MKNLTKILVIPDLHVPVHDPVALNAVEQYMGDEEWDIILQLGDFMDFDMISDHNKEKLRENEKRRILSDYIEGKIILDRWKKLAPKAKFVILEGNHDYRVERYIDRNPETEGLLEVEVGLGLKERNIQWIRSWSEGEIFSVGKANFIHGLYTCDHHAKKHLQVYGINLFYGHLHDFQTYSMTTQGDNKTRVAQSLGCLLKYRQLYMKGRPNRWQQGIAKFIVEPSGFFQCFPIRIFNGQFISPEGRVYKGKK